MAAVAAAVVNRGILRGSLTSSLVGEFLRRKSCLHGFYMTVNVHRVDSAIIESHIFRHSHIY